MADDRTPQLNDKSALSEGQEIISRQDAKLLTAITGAIDSE